ncbi:hypothetical protein TRIUR3_28153 [Triticum urartu]|uniref:Uncharacterized protein n=1 Tax=Triticum urartu TaxID=4572 RepID=M7ZLZ4_TRIUA|nr:hypothetical protein TRIUR3_28153 [Triticum urartu]
MPHATRRLDIDTKSHLQPLHSTSDEVTPKHAQCTTKPRPTTTIDVRRSDAKALLVRIIRKLEYVSWLLDVVTTSYLRKLNKRASAQPIPKLMKKVNTQKMLDTILHHQQVFPHSLLHWDKLQPICHGPLAVGHEEVEQCSHCVLIATPHGHSAELDKVIEDPHP